MGTSGHRSQQPSARQLVDHFFRHEYAQLVASLTRRFGVSHWDLVEDVVQSALQRALSSWSLRGVPPNPSAWLHRVAANLAVDALRRNSRTKNWDTSFESSQSTWELAGINDGGQSLQDDQLRMMFVCCDPSVPPESSIALALKMLCGFGHGEIARALFTTEASVAKRITRAKNRLRAAGTAPGELDEETLRTRLPHVQSVIYLLFNEGYSSTVADKYIREDLCEEAVRLSLLLAEHPVTKSGTTAAFLALQLFHAARLEARIDQHGAILLLQEQDRKLWDRRLLNAAYWWLGEATQDGPITRYHAEALIAGEHCRGTSIRDTNWKRIVQAYDLLCSLDPSPVHALNRAIAIGHDTGPAAGLRAFRAIDSQKLPRNYYLWHATHADLARQMGDVETARQCLEQAWKLAPTNAEKELICRKLDALN